jgi:hypothetical protein
MLAGERQEADRTFGGLLENAHAVHNPESRLYLLQVVGLGQLRAGERAQGEATLAAARETARGIEEDHRRAMSLISLATAEAQAGEFAIALETSAEITEPYQYSRPLAAIAAAQVRTGDRPAAHETVHRIENTEARVEALLDIAAEREAGLHEAARATRAIALEAAIRTEGAWRRSRLMREVARSQIAARDPRPARDTVAAMLSAAQAATDQARRDAALASVATVQAQSGALPAAMCTLGAIMEDGPRSTVLVEIAQAQARAGEFDIAWSIVRQLSFARLQDGALAAVVSTQIQTEGREQQPLGATLDQILQIAQGLEDGGDRMCMLVDVAVSLARVGAFPPALEVARAVEWDERRADALGEIAALQALAGNTQAAQLLVAEAVDSAQRIPQAWWRVDPLLEIAAAFLEAGEREEARTVLAVALAAAEAMEDGSGRDDEFRRIAEAQGEARDYPAGLETAERIRELPRRAAAMASIARSQAEAGAVEAARTTLLAVEVLTQQIDWPGGNDEALPQIARTQALLSSSQE